MIKRFYLFFLLGLIYLLANQRVHAQVELQLGSGIGLPVWWANKYTYSSFQAPLYIHLFRRERDTIRWQDFSLGLNLTYVETFGKITATEIHSTYHLGNQTVNHRHYFDKAQMKGAMVGANFSYHFRERGLVPYVMGSAYLYLFAYNRSSIFYKWTYTTFIYLPYVLELQAGVKWIHRSGWGLSASSGIHLTLLPYLQHIPIQVGLLKRLDMKGSFNFIKL